MKILGTDTEFDFGAEAGLERVTCVNHPDANYLTKGPSRNLHFVGWDRLGRLNLVHPDFGFGECPCTYADLRVVVEGNQPIYPGTAQLLEADPERCKSFRA